MSADNAVSILNGALRRTDAGWVWRDGTPETRITDMTLGRCGYSFRCRTDGSGETYVEVPMSTARREDDLRWVVAGVRVGLYQHGASGDHTGPLAIGEDGTVHRMHVEPGSDPLLGHPADAAPERPGAIPTVALVPIAEWDERASTVVGAEWAAAHEHVLLTLAVQHGWAPPAGYVSPQGWRAP